MDNIKKIQHPIYLTPDMLEEIKKRASEKDWSINKWIINTLSNVIKGK